MYCILPLETAWPRFLYPLAATTKHKSIHLSSSHRAELQSTYYKTAINNTQSRKIRHNNKPQYQATQGQLSNSNLRRGKKNESRRAHNPICLGEYLPISLKTEQADTLLDIKNQAPTGKCVWRFGECSAIVYLNAL